MNRVTEKDLEAVVRRINLVTNNPREPYTGNQSNPGNYHLSMAYGGYALHRMGNSDGGAIDVFNMGHMSKRELRDLMFAYLHGYWEGKVAK